MPTEPKKIPILRAQDPFQRDVREILRRLWGAIEALDASTTATFEEIAGDDIGDIDGVLPGVNLSGGGTTGTVTLDVIDSPTFAGDVVVESTLEVQGNTDLQSDVDIGDDLDVIGEVTLHNTVEIDGVTTIHDHLTVDGGQLLATKAVGTGTTTGNANLILGETTAAAAGTGASLQFDTLYGVGAGGEGAAIIKVKRLSDVLTGADLAFAVRESGTAAAIPTVMTLSNVGALSVVGGSLPNFTVGASKFTVAGLTGNTVVAGTLNVNGAVDLDTTLNVNGATDLDSTLNVDGAADFNSTVNIDGTLTLSTMTIGSVLFAGTGGLVSQDNTNFTWDNTNKALTVITTSTSAAGSFINASATTGALRIRNTNASGPVDFFAVDSAGTVKMSWGYGNSGYEAARALKGYVWRASSTDFVFARTATVDATLFSDGNWNLGSTTTNPSVKLRVEGALTTTGNSILGDTAASDTHALNGNTTVTGSGSATFKATSTGGTQITVTGDSDGSGNSAYTGFAIQRIASQIWFIGRDGTGDTDGLIFRRAGATDDMKLDTSGNFSIATNKFTVAAATGNTVVAGTLNTVGAVDFDSTLNVDGNCTLGNAVTDTVTIAGLVGINGAAAATNALTITHPGTTGSGVRVNNAVAAQTSTNGSDVLIVPSGTWDTTGATCTHSGVRIVSSITRSAGANTLFQNGFAIEVSGGQDTNRGCSIAVSGTTATENVAVNASASGSSGTNYSFKGTAGTLYNAGAVDFDSTLDVDGNVTLGNATSDAHTINGSLQVIDDGAAVNVTATPSGSTVQRIACQYVMQGTYDTTAGAITAIGTYGAISSARSAGANDLTNVGMLANASGGQVNVALQTNAGDVIFNAVSGTTNIRGAADLDSTLNVDGAVTCQTDLTVNGNCAFGNATSDTHTVTGRITQTEGAHQFAYVSTHTPVAAAFDTFAFNMNMAGSLDATAATRTSVGLYALTTTTKSAGANALNNYGLLADCTGGTNNYAVFTERGNVVLNNTSGTTNIKGAADLDSTLNVDGAATFVSTVSIQGNATIGNADTDAHTDNGTMNFNKIVGATVSTNIGNIVLTDTTVAQAANNGGNLVFAASNTAGGNIVNGAFVKLCKTNSTDSNSSFDLVLGGRTSGSSPAEVIRIQESTGVKVTGTLWVTSSLEIDGALNHDGTTVGFYGTAPVTQAAAITSLTDSSGGTANNTVQALTDPTDTPASADALRDNLVAVLIPELRNNFADLTAKVNGILAAIRGMGIIAT